MDCGMAEHTVTGNLRDAEFSAIKDFQAKTNHSMSGTIRKIIEAYIREHPNFETLDFDDIPIVGMTRNDIVNSLKYGSPMNIAKNQQYRR